eukprot:11980210-Alexandrium_andersonii.AAC.1
MAGDPQRSRSWHSQALLTPCSCGPVPPATGPEQPATPPQQPAPCSAHLQGPSRPTARPERPPAAALQGAAGPPCAAPWPRPDQASSEPAP